MAVATTIFEAFVVAELEARVRALLRRGEPMGTEITFGSLTFEKAARHLTVHGQEIELTPSELAVLELLLSRPGRIVSKADIFNSLYSWQDNANMSAVEVFISRLRRKLSMADADVGIRVFRGLGYRLEKSADARIAAARPEQSAQAAAHRLWLPLLGVLLAGACASVGLAVHFGNVVHDRWLLDRRWRWRPSCVPERPAHGFAAPSA
jgi:DNA-binding winged helix-turn-helix (wHTH) protein